MVIERTPEWRKQRHDVLDEYIELFGANAHKYLDHIIDSRVIEDDWLLASESMHVLPQTVMNIVCAKCKWKPKDKQVIWKQEVAILKKVIK